MTKGKIQHVLPHQDGGWAVKGQGNTRATKICATQREAIQLAKQIARNNNSKTKIHNKNGTVKSV